MTYNEIESGNLERYLISINKYCDSLIVYDDGSTDGTKDFIDAKWSGELHYKWAPNDFKNELAHKQWQLDIAKEAGIDWVIRIDADETIDADGEKSIRDILYRTSAPSFAFHTINLWRSPCFYRLDSGFNDVVFNRLWSVSKDLHFKVETGLHLTNYPVGVTDGEVFSPFEIIHWGFSSNKAILDKYYMYRAHGQSGWALDRLINESKLVLAKSKIEWFSYPLPNADFNKVFEFPIKSLVISD